MKPQAARRLRATLGIGTLLIALDVAYAQEGQRGQSSYMPVDITESFKSVESRLSNAKSQFEQEHSTLPKIDTT